MSRAEICTISVLLMCIDKSMQQVQNLLESMGLRQYKDMFLQEQISGDILIQCSDLELRDELKVSKKIHRMRLMKIIDGSHSAQSIMKGLDPYGQA